MYIPNLSQPLNGCSTCGMGNIDLLPIGLQSISEAITKLPEGDLLAILAQLPEETMRKICKKGVADEAKSYIPWALAAGGAFLLFKVMK